MNSMRAADSEEACVLRTLMLTIRMHFSSPLVHGYFQPVAKS
jgi:hypothetical protein